MSTTVASAGAVRPSMAWPSVIRPDAVYANARELCTYALEPEPGKRYPRGMDLLRDLEALESPPRAA